MKAIGVDIGTAFIASARYNKDNVAAKMVRDGFFVMPYLDQRKHMLTESKVPFIVKDRPNVEGKRDIFVIGNEAFDMAVLFGQELRRPLASGVISAREKDTEFILKEIIRRVSGQGDPGDVAYFSIPANPVDADFNNIYHREMFRRFLSDLGYKAEPINEALAVAWCELEDKELTGVSISWGAGMANCCLAYRGLEVFSFSVARCLEASTLVCTDKGFVPIKNIIPGYHRVSDSHGILCEVDETVNNGVRSDLFGITVSGLGMQRVATSDHPILVQSGINWSYVATKDLKAGMTVGEPVIHCTEPIKQVYFGNTPNGDGTYRCIKPQACRNVGRFIGAFLGDGHAIFNTETSQYHVSIAFNKKDVEGFRKYTKIVESIFPAGTSIRLASHGKESSVVNLKITDKIIAKKMLEFYDDDGVKTLPISLNTIPDNMALGILEGLLDSDGYISPDKSTISFCNTSSQLVWVFRQLLGRVGIQGALQIRKPRTSGHKNKRGVPIVGTKIVYEYKIGTKHDVVKLLCMFSDYDGHSVYGLPVPMLSSVIKEVVPIQGRAVEVYDLRIRSENHSFTLPYMTVHNCGDWIDQQVAQSRGIAVSDATAEKEAEDLDLLAPKNDIQEAITIFYKAMLEYVIGHLSAAMEKHRRDIKVKEPLNFVVAGGTTMPKGFLRLLAEALKENPLPIPVGKVWQAKNPVLAVCKGCLKAAHKLVQDDTYDGVKDISEGKNEKHAYPTKPKEAPKAEKMEMSPKDKREQEERAKVVSNVVGGYAEAIDLTLES